MTITENKISDLNVYLTRMSRSILDKMFFVDKVFEPFEYILDFGCANGELIKAISAMCPEYQYIGYDICDNMISVAKDNVSNATFYTNWNDIHIPFNNSLINISSTIHEVYSYGTNEDINEFWNRIFNSGFKYITIRDMMFSKSQNRIVDNEQLTIIKNHPKYSKLFEDFQKINGKVITQKDLVHFLLKYKYIQNWDREVRENYFPIYVEELLDKIPNNYRIIFQDTFTLPYTAWQIRKDFRFDLKENTHIKLILEKIS